MSHPEASELSRRERQIMDILYRRGTGAVSDVRDEMSDPPSYSAVRALLRILEEKGHLTHEESDGRYLYRPKVPQQRARTSALKRLVETFFDNSVDEAVLALLELKEGRDPKDVEKLRKLLDNAKSKKK